MVFLFDEYPNKYACWWGIKSLPEVKEECEEYLEFITGQKWGCGQVAVP